MAQMLNLVMDMAEEVLCRIPLTSLRNVRSTCTKWKTLSKAEHFSRKSLDQIQAAARKESMAVMMLDYRLNLMGFNLHNKDKVESCISHQGKLISLDDDSDEINVCQVFHCDGLLLCISKDKPRIVVWNPYSGQTRFIKSPRSRYPRHMHLYALGFDRSTKSHKILRVVDNLKRTSVKIIIYNFKSDSWRVLDDDLLSNTYILPLSRGVSLGGNNYWFAYERQHVQTGFLICFDFESETFGPHLPLPFEPQFEDTVTLSSVREEQLVVLFQQWDTLLMEIWVTTKIEPNAVSWNTKVFLSVNMRPLTRFGFQFCRTAASFFIDEETKVVVVFDKDKEEEIRNVAYIVGVDGTLKEADLGGRRSEIQKCFPLACSYAPSLVEF